MTQTRAAQRYAKAVMQIAGEENALDQLIEDFRTLRGAIENSRDLQLFLQTPVVDVRVKARILQQIFNGKLGAVMDRFVALLTKKGRAVDLRAIVDAFFDLLDKQQNVVTAKITTAVKLEAAQREAIEQKIRSMSGKTVRAEYAIDAGLIGGFRALFSDTMIDASVRHQLDRIYQSFVGGSRN